MKDLLQKLIEGLPLELLEMLLVKATILTFKQLIKLASSSRTARLATLTVLTVCRQWSRLTTREFVQQQIKQTYDC